MLLNPRIFSSAVAVALTCAVSAAAYYYASRKAEFNEVLVFCKLQHNAYHYFDKMISYIEEAKKSLHICMPSIHNPAFQGHLVSMIKKKKIKICMIIDRTGYNGSTHFFIKELIEAGAEIKCKIREPVFKMQHKFCLIDDKVLMAGTLDWGNDRCGENWNYVYVTNKSKLVDPVKKEFHQMWSQVSGNLHTIAELNPDESYGDNGPEIANARRREIADARSQEMTDSRSQQIADARIAEIENAIGQDTDDDRSQETVIVRIQDTADAQSAEIADAISQDATDDRSQEIVIVRSQDSADARSQETVTVRCPEVADIRGPELTDAQRQEIAAAITD